MTNDQPIPNELEQSTPTADNDVQPVTPQDQIPTPAEEAVSAAEPAIEQQVEAPAVPVAETEPAIEAPAQEAGDAEAAPATEEGKGEGDKKSRRKPRMSEEEAAVLWAELDKAKEEETVLAVKCVRAIPGGALVDYKGLEGFIPRSQFQLTGRAEQGDIEQYLDQDIEAVVVEITNVDRRKYVCSRKKALKKGMFNRFTKGDTIEGVVTSITHYGVFVDLGGVDGLIHISRLSKSHVKTPAEVVQLHQTVKVRVVSVDAKSERIALSMKEFTESPWGKIGDTYATGTMHVGRVKNITSFGVYIQLEPGIVGMVHISDLSWTRRIQHPTEVVKIGQELEVKVIDCKPQEKRIALSVKDTQQNPWMRLANIYPVGTETDGVLKQVMDAGAIVSLDFDIDCFVPRGKMGIRKPRRGQGQGQQTVEAPMKAGDAVRVKVVEMDPDKRSFICSLIRDDAEGKHSDDKPSFTVAQSASDRAFTLSDLPGMEALLGVQAAMQTASHVEAAPVEEQPEPVVEAAPVTTPAEEPAVQTEPTAPAEPATDEPVSGETV